VSFLKGYRGEIRRVLAFVIEASGHAHRTAGGEIGLRAFHQAAGKLAVIASTERAAAKAECRKVHVAEVWNG
jgi:hypothetical protein